MTPIEVTSPRSDTWALTPASTWPPAIPKSSVAATRTAHAGAAAMRASALQANVTETASLTSVEAWRAHTPAASVDAV